MSFSRIYIDCVVRPILKFRLFYLAFVMAPFIFIFIISIDVKNTDIFTFIMAEVLLISGLVSSMYLTLEMIAICIRNLFIKIIDYTIYSK